MSPNLSSTIAGMMLEFPVGNASGPRCTYAHEINNLIQSDSGYIVTKSLTKNPRTGNSSPKWFADNENTINANGLENLGFESTMDFLSQFKKTYPNKLIIPSIAVLDAMDSLDMVDDLVDFHSNFPMVELNVSCPNIPGKPILANSLERLDEYLEMLLTIVVNSPIKVGIKLPFYTDKIIVQEVDDILIKNEIDYIVICNSFPFSTDVDLDSYNLCIHPNSGLGGLGGGSILRPALGQIRMHYANLKGKIDIVGVGGITDAQSALKHFVCGASAVQIGSAFSIYGCNLFGELKEGIVDYLVIKNIPNLSDIIGIAKNMPSHEVSEVLS